MASACSYILRAPARSSSWSSKFPKRHMPEAEAFRSPLFCQACEGIVNLLFRPCQVALQLVDNREVVTDHCGASGVRSLPIQLQRCLVKLDRARQIALLHSCVGYVAGNPGFVPLVVEKSRTFQRLAIHLLGQRQIPLCFIYGADVVEHASHARLTSHMAINRLRLLVNPDSLRRVCVADRIRPVRQRVGFAVPIPGGSVNIPGLAAGGDGILRLLQIAEHHALVVARARQNQAGALLPRQLHGPSQRRFLPVNVAQFLPGRCLLQIDQGLLRSLWHQLAQRLDRRQRVMPLAAPHLDRGQLQPIIEVVGEQREERTINLDRLVIFVIDIAVAAFHHEPLFAREIGGQFVRACRASSCALLS